MLAWLHQATASEKEHLEALLKQVTLKGISTLRGLIFYDLISGSCDECKAHEGNQHFVGFLLNYIEIIYLSY